MGDKGGKKAKNRAMIKIGRKQKRSSKNDRKGGGYDTIQSEPHL